MGDGLPQDWSRWRQQFDLSSYDERWRQMAAAGENPHGEADLVCGYQPTSVLDAGCGTGRVAIELARRGIDVVGTDLEPDMIDKARAKAPELTWVQCDVAGFQLRPDWSTLAEYDGCCAAAELQLDERFATWDREPYAAGDSYAVSVHRNG